MHLTNSYSNRIDTCRTRRSDNFRESSQNVRPYFFLLSEKAVELFALNSSNCLVIPRSTGFFFFFSNILPFFFILLPYISQLDLLYHHVFFGGDLRFEIQYEFDGLLLESVLPGFSASFWPSF